MLDVQEETSGKTRRQQWHKELSLKEQLHLGSERTSGKDLQEGSHTGDHEAGSQIFHQDSKNDGLDIVEDLVPTKMENETAYRIQARDL
jgi:hypothetical protein